jgi:type II secretory pathway pseudopilin PulG
VTDAGRRRSCERGLSLVEVLLALALVATGLAGLAVVLPVSIHGLHEARQLSTATFLAEQALERARATTWTRTPPTDCLGVSSGDAAPVPTGLGCGGTLASRLPDETDGIDGAPQYRRQVRVSGCETTACAGLSTSALRRVEVTVRYAALTSRGVAADGRAIRLEALVAPR